MILHTAFRTFEFRQGLKTGKTEPAETKIIGKETRKPEPKESKKTDTKQGAKTDGKETGKKEYKLVFSSHEDALAWLKQLGFLQSNLIVRLREYVTRTLDDPEYFRSTDHQTLERLALLLYLQRIMVIVREHRAPSGQPTATSPTTAPAFPLDERPTSTPSSTYQPPPSEAPTFPANVLAAAQAATLIAAAAAGTPFCEQCMKAKAAQSAGSQN